MPSLLNGLSAMGQGVAAFAGPAALEAQKNAQALTLQQNQQQFQTGLQASDQTFQSGLVNQKAALEAEQAKLADTLATARESAGRTQAGQIAATAAEKAQTFAASENTANRAAEMARTQAQINAPPDTVKLLRALGALPDPNAAPSPAPPSATPSTPSSGDNMAPAGAQAPAPDLSSNPLVAKVLGLGTPGSDVANRQAIAADVNADPKFKYASVGQKAAEIENRLAIASAKMPSPEDQRVISEGMANYSLSPLDARARMMNGGPGAMADVLRINPKYSETNYDAIKETQKAIAPGGTLYTPISAMNTSMGHAAHFLDVATQLGNFSGGNWANIIPNKIAQNTGSAPLVNALQQTAFAMAEEGNKIYAGNSGTETAIDHWYKTFPVNGSLADQVGAVKNFAQLMGDKFDTMTDGVNKTFTGSGLPPVQLLTPKAETTYQRLISAGPDGKPPPAGPPSDPLGIRR